MADVILEPVSPELALVCPELAERARARLPVPDLDARRPPRPHPARRRGTNAAVVLAAASYLVLRLALLTGAGMLTAASLVTVVSLFDR